MGNLSRRILSYAVVAMLTLALLLPMGLASFAEGEEPPNTPTPPPTIAGEQKLKVIVGYSVGGVDSYIERELSYKSILEKAAAKEKKYSSLTPNADNTGFNVSVSTAQGFTLDDILFATGLNINKDSIETITLNSSADDYKGRLLNERKYYKELYKHLTVNGIMVSLTEGHLPESEAVPALFSFFDGRSIYEIGEAVTEPVETVAPTESAAFKLFYGQAEANDQVSSKEVASVKITLKTPTVTTIDEAVELSLGETHVFQLAIPDEVHPELTKLYFKNMITSWTVDTEGIVTLDADNMKVTADKAGKVTVTANTSFGIAVIKSVITIHPDYTVDYNKNTTDEVSNLPTQQIKKHGTDLELDKKSPERTNWVFVGWDTRADGSGTRYQPGEIYRGNESVALYAIWKEPSFTITYNPNLPSGVTGTPSGLPSSETVAKDANHVLPAPGMTGGYEFSYWSERADEDQSIPHYTASTSIKVEKDMTLYAHWKKQTYTVTFDPNGGKMYVTNSTGESSYTLQAVAAGTTLTLSNYTCKNGSTRPTHWQIKGTTTKISATSGVYTVNSNTILVAVWPSATAKPTQTPTFSVTYNANAGSESVTNMPSKQTANKGKSITISSQVPVRAGYTFVSWNTKKDGTGKEYKGGTTSTSALTLYAKWTAVVITPSPTPSPVPTPEPTRIPNAELEDPIQVQPIESRLEPVIFIGEASPTPEPAEGEGGAESKPTPNPWNEHDPEEPVESEESQQTDTTYAIVGIANGILLAAGGCLAVVKFNLEL